VASQVGSDVAATLSGSLGYGFDFNPVPDRIRVIDGGPNTNLRYHPVTGALVSTDGPLAFNAGDPNFGAEPNVVGAGYINNFPGATSTTLYGIDALNDVLVTVIPPNSGGVNTVGSLGIDALGTIGFDVDAMGNAFMSSTITQSVLYSVNLSTGAATAIGAIGNGVVLRGLAARLPNSAVVPEPVPAVLLGLGLLGLLRRRVRS
jgi:MYXO-CTERM domain-containing protein